MMNRHRDKRQLSLFDTAKLPVPEEPGGTILYGIPTSRAHLEGAAEFRAMQQDSDRYPWEGDLVCGFRYRFEAFEYVARLWELAAYRWLLEQILTGLMTEEDGRLQGLMPWVFEQFCGRLPLFIWDCWAEVTRQSHDGGLDGVVYARRHGQPVAAIQAKYYSAALRPSAIREFYGALIVNVPALSHGFLLTTASQLPPVLGTRPGVYVGVAGLAEVRRILEITRLLPEYLVAYSASVAVGDAFDNEEWSHICARYVVARELIARVLGVPNSWPCPLRKEQGVDDAVIEQWRNVPFEQLF